MKKTSEELSNVQKQEAIRRDELESGKIRIPPEKPKTPARQEEETDRTPQKDSS
ncbi:MAG: hypothetical protein O6926_06140 [candidate division NC10 bacterium]|nr:hypothetical protein [candidate division NC10 bacterium]